MYIFEGLSVVFVCTKAVEGGVAPEVSATAAFLVVSNLP